MATQKKTLVNQKNLRLLGCARKYKAILWLSQVSGQTDISSDIEEDAFLFLLVFFICYCNFLFEFFVSRCI